MRQHTALRVGRTTRCRDFPAASSAITTFRDLIPAWRLFVFNGTRAWPRPARVSGRCPGKGVTAVMRDLTDLPGSPGNRYASPASVQAAEGRLRTSGAGGGRPRRPGAPGRCRTGHGDAAAGFLAAPPPGEESPPIGQWDPRGRAGRRGIGHVRRRRGGPDRLVCVGPRTFRPSGAGSFEGTRAIGSVEERCRSHRGGHWFEPSIAHKRKHVSQRPAYGSGSVRQVDAAQTDALCARYRAPPGLLDPRGNGTPAAASSGSRSHPRKKRQPGCQGPVASGVQAPALRTGVMDHPRRVSTCLS